MQEKSKFLSVRLTVEEREHLDRLARESGLSLSTIVWNYIGELIFNMLVLVGAIKMSDRLVRELMGLG